MGNPQPSSKLSQQNRLLNKMGFIYSITSPIGKIYIGQTRRDVEKRKTEHFKCPGSCILLENAIKKYGQEQMKCEVLLEINDELLDEHEKKFIEMYNALEPNGYNIRSGGVAGIHSEQSRVRMRDAKLGEKNHNFGKPRSDEFKAKLSAAKSGEKHHFFGKKLSDEHKLALATAHRKSHAELPMYVVYVKPRPEQYQGSGYAVANHPTLKNKYFTSKKLLDDEKLNQALEYLHSA
jgi:group I intron endonuclease